MSDSIIEKTREKLARYESRHDKIVEAAIKIFNARGYTATTIARIAKEAGVGERDMYRHFKNKRAIFSECINSIMAEIDNIWRKESGNEDGDGLAYFKAFTSSYVNFVKNNPDKSLFLVHLYTYRTDPDMNEGFKKFINERFDEAEMAINLLKGKNVVKSKVDSRVLAGVFIGQYFSAVLLSEFTEPESLNADVAMEIVKNILKID